MKKLLASAGLALAIASAPAAAVTVTGFTITPSTLNNRLPALGGTIAQFNQPAVGFQTLNNNNVNYKIESSDVVLTSNLALDVGSAMAGKTVSSVLFLIDTNNPNGLVGAGSVTFSQNIIGIQRLSSTLRNASSAQISGDTTFVFPNFSTVSGSQVALGLEFNDVVTFSGKTVNFVFGAPNNEVDVFRVITQVPEPQVWAMLLAGFGMVGIASRRRRSTVAA
jgi:hypothetical protein